MLCCIAGSIVPDVYTQAAVPSSPGPSSPSCKALWSFQTSGSMGPTTQRTIAETTTIRTSNLTVSCCFKTATVNTEENYVQLQPELQDFRSDSYFGPHYTASHTRSGYDSFWGTMPAWMKGLGTPTKQPQAKQLCLPGKIRTQDLLNLKRQVITPYYNTQFFQMVGHPTLTHA
jgi:hypothetical protein